MDIRPCNYKTDLDYIFSTAKSLYEYNNSGKMTSSYFNWFKEDILFCKNKQKAKIFILDDNCPKGYIQFFIRKGKSERKILTISKVYVDNKNRKQGIGSLLLDKAKEFAKENSCDIIRLNSFEINREFYSKNGFKIESYSMIYEL